MLANVAANHLVSGDDAARYGNGHPNIVPYRTFPTADGELAVSVGNDDQFARFAELLGHPEWATDERFVRNQDRVTTATPSTRWWPSDAEPAPSRLDRGARTVGIPRGPINSVAEALASRQTRPRTWWPTSTTHCGRRPVVGIPFQMFGTPPSIAATTTPRPAQPRGAGDELGLDEEIASARRAGVTTSTT